MRVFRNSSGKRIGRRPDVIGFLPVRVSRGPSDRTKRIDRAFTIVDGTSDRWTDFCCGHFRFQQRFPAESRVQSEHDEPRRSRENIRSCRKIINSTYPSAPQQPCRPVTLSFLEKSDKKKKRKKRFGFYRKITSPGERHLWIGQSNSL